MSGHQMSLKLIQHEVNNSVIEQRSSDGFINATQLCLVANRFWHQYRSLESTGHFLRALAAKMELAIPDLIQEVTIKGGDINVWVHPKVSVHLAQWLSADFAVQVSEWVYDWLSGAGPVRGSSGLMPYHIRRHMLNLNQVPSGYFSILQEMTFFLIAPLDQHGYELPEHMVPDISMGRFLCNHLRGALGIDTDSLPVYLHRYPDGRVVEAKLYPEDVLAEFRRLIREQWLPNKAATYFGERDPQALPYLDKIVLALPGPNNIPRISRKKK